jgi:predicted metal-binding protein
MIKQKNKLLEEKMNQQQQQLNIDPANLRDELCHKCENPYFQQVFRIQSLSALLSPNGQDIIAPVPTFVCTSCGEEFSKEL